MASNRHLGRIIALQTLYEQDFRRDSDDATFDLSEVLKRNIARYEATIDDTTFIEKLVAGVDGEQDQLDAVLQPLAPEWPISQIARMDRVILRMGAYELLHSQSVPPKVVINEAVELAKAFGSTNSSKFVNGVLGTLLRKQQGDDTPANSDAPADDTAADTTSDTKEDAEEARPAKEKDDA